MSNWFLAKKLSRSSGARELFIDTERNINNIVRKISTALRDNSAKPRFLETVVGKGYRFIGPVRVIDARHTHTDLGQVPARQVSAWGERTSLAVLPLLLLGNATDDRGLCLGFADAVVSRLGNLQGIDVLPTSAVLDIPAETTASEIASRLGVRFVVHGAIQVTKGQSRLSVEMFDAHLSKGCYARQCDFDLEHLPELEDGIAKQIATALNRKLEAPPSQRRPRYSKRPAGLRGVHAWIPA